MKEKYACKRFNKKLRKITLSMWKYQLKLNKELISCLIRLLFSYNKWKYRQKEINRKTL